ncbi:MAG: inositol monophosphatase family protein, partial [bacterium]|nr:inositol monophosphatase family protein [bacterium]
NAETFIKKTAVEAGKLVWKRFGKDKVSYMKSGAAWNSVTKADLMAERMIVKNIRKHFPSHGIIAEESGVKKTNTEYVWTIDPIDGTTNFSLGIPFFGVMLALMHKKQVILSAIYLPATEELFFAKKGKGAFLNGKKIRCSKTKTLGRSHGITTPFLSPKDVRFLKKIFNILKSDRFFLHAFGSKVGFCYVACGRADWKVSVAGALHDFTAPYLLLKEAGCTITTLKGKPWTLNDREMLAANPHLHKELVKLTKKI